MSDVNVVSDVVGAAGYSKPAEACKPAGPLMENRREWRESLKVVFLLSSLPVFGLGSDQEVA